MKRSYKIHYTTECQGPLYNIGKKQKQKQKKQLMFFCAF